MAAAINPVRGSKHPKAKFTEDEVKLILELLKERDDLLKRASYLSFTKLAEKFECHKNTIQKIAYAKSWVHV